MKQFILAAALLATQGAWAQSGTDLPALPPGMESPPAVELPPPPELPPALPAVEDLPPPPTPVAEQQQAPAPAEQPQAETQQPAPAATTASEVFEPTNAPAPAQENAAAEPTEILPDGTEVKKDFKPSYGQFEQSLLFGPDDIDRMKKMLYMYERVKRPEGVVQPVQDEFAKLIEAPPEVIAVSEPPTYPSFYLSSIVYRSPRDWLFWMNGTKYSPKTMPGYMEMVSINARQVTLMWKPEYLAAAQMRYEQKAFDTSMPLHFRSRMSQVRWDKEKEAFLFTLSPNQSFVSAAFAVFEGKHADRSVPELKQEMQVQEMLEEAAMPPSQQGFNDPDAKLKATMRGLQQVDGNLSQLSPRSNPNASGNAAQPGDAPAPVDPMAGASLPTIERAM